VTESRIIETLTKLISFKSITPQGRDALEYVAEICRGHGFKCDLREFGPEEEKTSNLYAILGNGSPNICFAGHVDVVPPGDEKAWKNDPFTAVIADGRVYGRGAVDMKGAIACFIVAVEDLLKTVGKIKGGLSLLLTSDEEGSAKYGTKIMLDYIGHRYPKIDFCIVGEPTSKNSFGDLVKIGRRGSVNFNLTLSGKQGHVAYPTEAQNPVPILVKLLHELINTELDTGNEFFGPSVLTLTSVDVGNNVTNVIPAKASAIFNIRFNNFHTASSLVAKIESIIEKYTNAENMQYNLRFSSSADSFLQPVSSKMQELSLIHI
jgi:succinyl-diaminopimelate desuccinylase